ncbi:uncharacterized protein LOC116223868 [Clupea harengus]|uniref:Uncharacterized protein LOC116223868 n=1 Tax=Clupea harengus TaxID=7950 RepID=A0A6P8GFQ3_CLUHA|nr:uncharacterized protein LOC116223868 [Clupea harengus]
MREETSDCPNGWRSEAGPTCSTSNLQIWNRGVYWCESQSGQHSNAVNITMNRRPRPVLRVSPHSWPAEGDSVTLSCEVSDTSLNWTFLWYRAVPYTRTAPFREDSPDVRYRGSPYSVELLSDSSRGAGGSYTLSPAALKHTGLYVCRAEGGDPTYQTDYSDVKRFWVTGLSPPASLVIRPNRTQLFESESLSVSCEVLDKSTGWRLRWETMREETSDCPNGWRSEAGPTCSTSNLQTWDRGVYWCESQSGQHSNAVNITMNRTPRPVLRVSPHSWPAEGDSVTLSCEVRDTSLNWTFLWYRAVPYRRTAPFREDSADVRDRGSPYSVELLSDSSRGAGGSYTLSPAALKHTGLYVCRAEGGDPTYQTDYSDVKRFWVTGLSPPASLFIRPNRTQLFESESLSLSCEGLYNSTGWRLRWETMREETSDCPNGWRSEAGPTCSTSNLETSDRGVYWCESQSGQHSNAVNITINCLSPPASLVIRPNRTQLFESESLSLSCEVLDKSTGWRLRWETTREETSDCPNGWRSEAGPTCSTSNLQTWDRGVYWCESQSGQHSNAVNITMNRTPRPVLRVSPHSWPAEGDSVTLSCEVRDTSLNWTFLWYRAVPYRRTAPFREDSPDVRYRRSPYSVELLSDSSRGAGGSYTLSPAALKHTGLYVCRAEGGDPTYQTDYSDVKRFWVTGLSPPASLVIRPNRTQLFESESLSLSCEVLDNSTGWRLRWETMREETSDCPNGWRSEAGPTCSTSNLETLDRGVYWCESQSGQHSNAVNITMNRRPRPVLRVSPHSWPAEGDSVTLSCEVRDTSLNWTLLWYRAVPYTRTAPFREDSPDVRDRGSPYSLKLLSDSSRGAGGSYTLSPAALKHTGLYVCRAEGGDPTYQTDYSDVKRFWVTGLSPPASLVIRPNSIQLYESESLSLSCEGLDNSTGWRLRWETMREETSDCPNGWRSEAGPTCRTSNLETSDRGVYWCESQSGQHSNAVNITMNNGNVILEGPSNPVTEGAPLTLRCISRKSPSTFSADFYRDGSLLQTEATGEMTIPVISKAHEGSYKCRHPQLGESPESWVTVINVVPVSLLPLTCSLLVFSLSVLGIVTLVVTCLRSKKHSQIKKKEVKDP